MTFCHKLSKYKLLRIGIGAKEGYHFDILEIFDNFLVFREDSKLEKTCNNFMLFLTEPRNKKSIIILKTKSIARLFSLEVYHCLLVLS